MTSLSLRNPKYGWIPDLPDQRDFLYTRLAVAIPALPKKADLRQFCSPIENQGGLGSCTAQALVGNLEFLKTKVLNLKADFSRLFVYYNERVIRHTTQVDSGASLRDGIKTLVKLGACLEQYWPYNIKKFKLKPPVKAYKDALNYQILSYFRIKTLAEMKHTLSLGFPFVFGFAVYESIENKKVKKTGIIPFPEIGERLLGGHAVMAVGYDDSHNWFIVRNSWSEKWGDSGYCYLPYSYLSSPMLTADFWTIRDME